MFDLVSKSVSPVLPTSVAEIFLPHSALNENLDAIHKAQRWPPSYCFRFAISQTVHYTLFFKDVGEVEADVECKISADLIRLGFR